MHCLYYLYKFLNNNNNVIKTKSDVENKYQCLREISHRNQTTTTSLFNGMSVTISQKIKQNRHQLYYIYNFIRHLKW